MPQTSDQIEQQVNSPGSDVIESNDRLLKPLQKSPQQKNGVLSENGSLMSGVGRVHSNGLLVSSNGAAQSYTKNQSNEYVCQFFEILYCYIGPVFY